MSSKSEPAPDKQGWDKVKDRVGVRSTSLPPNAMIPDPGHLRDTKGTQSFQEKNFNDSRYSASEAKGGISVVSSPMSSELDRKALTFSVRQPSVDPLTSSDDSDGNESDVHEYTRPDTHTQPSQSPSKGQSLKTHRGNIGNKSKSPSSQLPPVRPPLGEPKVPRRKARDPPLPAISDTSLSEIKTALAELQLMEAKRQLSELKKTKINQTTYNKFAASLDEKGLKLVTGDKKTTNFLGKEMDKNLTELLAGATIEYKDPINQAKILKTIQQRKDIAYKMELRDQIMKDTGREFGPDIALLISLKSFKADILKADNLKEGETNINSIINENSSITEVLNVLAFLINKKNERAKSIISDFSVKGGSHDENGMYDNENDIKSIHNPDHIKTVFSCLNEGDESPFNINTLEPYTPDESTTPPKGKLPPKIILPAGILKRKSDYTTQHFELTPEEIPKLFIACVLQMINLLQTTRSVFGDWAKLFKGMNGGGSKSKSKKTRRRNRNRN